MKEEIRPKQIFDEYLRLTERDTKEYLNGTERRCSLSRLLFRRYTFICKAEFLLQGVSRLPDFDCKSSASSRGVFTLLSGI